MRVSKKKKIMRVMLSYKYRHPCTGNHEVLNTEECQNQTQGSPHVNNKKNRHFDIV